MVPILFAATETAFTSNGLGRLADATKCEVTEERNGVYELVMEYPVNGKMYDQIECGKYIYATHDEGKTPQAFQIYKMSTPLDGVVTINAWHISYALNTIIVAPFTAGSCTAAIAGVRTHSMNTNPFTFWTDKSVTADFETTLPMSARAILGGTQGSILDVYGKGEYEFDMYTVKLHLNRGANRGVSIRYGKNLTQLDQTLDASNVYNACVPYWTNGEVSVVSDVIITKAGQTTGRTITMDLSSEFDEQPTLAELKAKAQTKIDASDSYTLKENLKIDFVALWQTEEYKNLASLQRIYLCDTVNIFYEKAGINVTAQCIKVVYDSLRERYVSMELGEPSTSLIQQIQQEVVGDVMEQVPNKTQMQAAIDKATELIGGGFGGYIKFNYLSDGTPSEMLVMDSPSESTATNIIRLNQNGLGFSTDGGTTYANAWTIDGNLNASFITTGVLNANLLTAGMIQDTSGVNYWNLDTGQFVTKQGEIGSFTIDQYGVKSGTVGEGTSGSSLLTTGLDYSYYNSGQQSTTKVAVSGQTLSLSASKGNGFVPAGVLSPSVSASGYGRLRIYVDTSDSPNLTMHDLDDSSVTYKNEISGNIVAYDGLTVGTNGASSPGVSITNGNITADGYALVHNGITVAPDGNYPEINFRTKYDSSRGGALTKSTGTNLNQFYFQQYHRSGGENSTYLDTYWLPASGTDNANHSYDIWTTKTLPDASTLDSTSITGCHLRKWGHVVQIALRGTALNSSGSIGTIPANFRTPSYIYSPIMVYINSQYRPGMFTLEADGTNVVNYFNGTTYVTATSGTVNGCITYIV